jgi:hypothetical protein
VRLERRRNAGRERSEEKGLSIELASSYQRRTDACLLPACCLPAACLLPACCLPKCEASLMVISRFSWPLERRINHSDRMSICRSDIDPFAYFRGTVANILEEHSTDDPGSAGPVLG